MAVSAGAMLAGAVASVIGAQLASRSARRVQSGRRAGEHAG
jgi:hypothetical protein